MSTPGWTWHVKLFYPGSDTARGVEFSSGGLDKNLKHFTREGAWREALRRLDAAPSFDGEAYIKSPFGVAEQVAERGNVWWPKLGAGEVKT